MSITVTFPNEEALRAAVEAVGIVVSAQDGREDTPHYAAERVLDAALLHHEEEAGEELPPAARALRRKRPVADKHGNRIAVEGVTRCACGAKYWEHDRCASCGADVPLDIAHAGTLRAGVVTCYLHPNGCASYLAGEG